MVALAGQSSLKPFSSRRARQNREHVVRAAVESMEVRRLLSVSPTSITLGTGSPIFTGGTDTKPVSVTLPSGSVVDKVDVVLLLDDTGSFTTFSTTVSSIFSALTSSLEAALPGVDFAFGVTRFEDYGGTGSGYSTDNNTARPFILNQPVVNATTAGSKAARNSLITTALAHTAPGFGGDGPESDIEGLLQVATGKGFDGNGNGNTSDSGAAGTVTTQTAPGTSGDIPAFSTNTLKTSGTLGGVGWRDGALHLVLLATDINPVAAFTPPTIPSNITGAGGKTVPVSAFAGSSTTPSSLSRFGFVGNSKSEMSNTQANAVAPSGAATVQATVTALNALGIRVLGMGPGAAPTTSTAPSGSPSTFLSALGRLTGALDSSGNPLVFSTSVTSAALTTAIVNAISTTTKLPIDIGLKTSGTLPTGLTFSFNTTGEKAGDSTPLVFEAVAPGGTGTFSAKFKGTGTVPAGSFDLDFVDVKSGAIVGTIPVTVTPPTTGGPSVSATVTSPIKENDTETLHGTISDTDTGAHTVKIDWGDGSAVTTLSLGAGVTTFNPTHKYLDDGPSPGNGTAQDTDSVKVDVSTSSKTFSTTASVTVQNVAPTVKLSGPTTATAGETKTFTGSFTDPGTLDVWTGTVDFGDGTPPAPITLAPDKTFSFDHAFAANGTYSVKATVTDDDTGSGSATVRVTVGTTGGGFSVSTGPDPCGDGTALFVNGSDLDEHIRVLFSGGKYTVTNDNPPSSQTFDGPFAHVIVHGNGGNDFLEAEEEVTTSVWMFGDAGNDKLQHEGGGFGILEGGAGDDSLHGGASEPSKGDNRDVLIGDGGSDVLDGDKGEDILITGTFDKELDMPTLCMIEDIWSTTDPFATRTVNLSSILNATSVHADGVSNLMYGNKDKDWYFCNRSGIGNAGAKDTINFIEFGEKITNIVL